MRIARVALVLSLIAFLGVFAPVAVRTWGDDKPPASKLPDLVGKKVVVVYVLGGELDESRIDSIEALGLWVSYGEKAPRRIFIPWSAVKSITLAE